MTISRYDEHIRRIVLSGNIRDETAAQFLESITAFERADMGSAITIYIDTYGGALRAALAIYDAMRICSCPVETIGIGKVMSAGALLLAAGDNGNRYLAPNTGVMIHQISGGAHGTVNEMNIILEETKKLQDVYVELLARHTGKSIKKISNDIMADNYMTAQEAINYGLADKVLPYRRAPRTKKNGR